MAASRREYGVYERGLYGCDNSSEVACAQTDIGLSSLRRHSCNSYNTPQIPPPGPRHPARPPLERFYLPRYTLCAWLELSALRRSAQRSRYGSFSLTSFHSSASGGCCFIRVIDGH